MVVFTVFIAGGLEAISKLSVEESEDGIITVELPYATAVAVGNTFEIKTDGTTWIKGTVQRIRRTRMDIPEKVITCYGKTHVLFEKYCLHADHHTYANKDVGWIAKDLIDHYFGGILTSGNVDDTTGVDFTTFDCYGRSVGDALRRLASRGNCYFYVANDDDVHFFVRGSVPSGLTLQAEDLTEIEIIDESGRAYTKVIVQGRHRDIQGSAGAGYPEYFKQDDRITSAAEAGEVAASLLAEFGVARQQATTRAESFVETRAGKTIILNVPTDGFNNTVLEIQSIRWECEPPNLNKTYFTVGNVEPTIDIILADIMRKIDWRPDTQILRGAAFPTDPSDGQAFTLTGDVDVPGVYYGAAEGILYTWDEANAVWKRPPSNLGRRAGDPAGGGEVTGDMYYNTTDEITYQWDGDSWEAAPGQAAYEYEFYIEDSTFKARKGKTGVVTSDAAANPLIQAAIDDVTEGAFFFHPGTYDDLELSIQDKRISIRGSGKRQTTFKPATGKYAITMEAVAVGDALHYPGYVKDLSIFDFATANGKGILMKRCSWGSLENLEVRTKGRNLSIEGGYNNRLVEITAQSVEETSYWCGGIENVITDETFNTGADPPSWVSLDHNWIQQGSEVVQNLAKNVTYDRDVDYAIGYMFGTIIRIDGGDMAANTDYYISYHYDEGAVDHVFTNCLAQNSVNGFHMAQSANGYQMTNCESGGMSGFNFKYEGGWSGGWGNGIIATDSPDGDGIIIVGGPDWYSGGLQLTNVWVSSCDRGLVIDGGTEHDRRVVDVEISNLLSQWNKWPGVEVKGFAYNVMIDGNLSYNNQGQKAEPYDCNLLIMNGPQQVFFDGYIGYPVLTDADTRNVKLFMDVDAAQYTIAYITNTTLTASPAAKSKIWFKNTHVSYDLQLFYQSIRAVDLGLDEIFEIDGDSTGVVKIIKIDFMPHGTSLPVYPIGGQYFYLETENILYRFDGTNWRPIHHTIGEGTSFPENPQKGDHFYRTDEAKLYFYDGSTWAAQSLLRSADRNLLENGSLEYPSIAKQTNPYGWTTAVWSGTPAFDRIDTDSVAGNYCITIEDESDEQGSWYSEYFPLTVGVTYLLSAYAKTSNASYKAEVSLSFLDKEKAWISHVELDTASLSWVRLSQTALAPAGTFYGRLELRGETPSGVTVKYSYDKAVVVEQVVSGTVFPSYALAGDIFYHESYQQSFQYDPGSGEPNIGGWVPLTRVVHQGTHAQMLASSVVEGDFWFATDTNGMYRYNGVSWDLIGISDAIGYGSIHLNAPLNAGFEDDHDNDQIPDFWSTYVAAGAGSIVQRLTDRKIGKACVRVTADTTESNIAALSDAFKINADKVYYWEVYTKNQRADNHDITVQVYGYNAEMGYLGSTAVINLQSGAIDAWTRRYGTVDIAADVHADAVYSRIGLFCATPDVASAWVQFDNFVFEEEVIGDKITSSQIIGKDFRTAEDVGEIGGPAGIRITPEEIAGYSGGVDKEFYILSSGKAYAGGGAVILDSVGIIIKGEGLYFQDAGAVLRGWVMGWAGANPYLQVGSAEDLWLTSGVGDDIKIIPGGGAENTYLHGTVLPSSHKAVDLGAPGNAFRYFIPTSSLIARHAPEAITHGIPWIVTAVGEKDRVFVCLKNALGEYQWIQIGVST